MNTSGIESAIFHVADALLIPVLIAALAALALTIVELGRLAMELYRRRGRSLPRLREACASALGQLRDGETTGATAALTACSGSARSSATITALVATVGEADGDDDRAKLLADFDYSSMRRLERTRILVRIGPALGLMGTLIPLAPALSALARGDVATLASDLRVAFSVTILGLLIGAIAFGLSLVRDRLYGQDLSDLEYIAAVLARYGSDA